MQERIPQVCIIKENESMTLTNPHNYPGLGIPAARMSDDTSFNHVDGVVLKNSAQAKNKGTFGVHCQRELGREVDAIPLGVLQVEQPRCRLRTRRLAETSRCLPLTVDVAAATFVTLVRQHTRLGAHDFQRVTLHGGQTVVRTFGPTASQHTYLPKLLYSKHTVMGRTAQNAQ